MVANAATVYDEQLDPDWLSIGLDELEGTQAPVLLTYGDLSPSWFYGVIAKVGENVPEAELQLIPGAGHAPHASHPLEFADAVAGFLGRVTAPV
jgi:pimeloyl-ACP methyl ester carboxylesterase